MTREPAELTRVYGYPFPAEDRPAPSPPGPLPSGRVAVLAFGANANVEVLAGKLGASAARRIVSLEVRVHGVDTVYSAHVSPYGAIPATLHPSPGTVLAARLLLLEPDVVPALDATEPNYLRVPLDSPGRVEVPGHGPVAAHAYRSKHGPLLLAGGPTALAEIRAERRALRARSQREIHQAVRDLLDPGAELDAFVLAGVRDPEVRAARTASLRALGQPARAPAPRG